MTEPRPVYKVADNGEPGAQIPLSIIAQIQWLLLQLITWKDGDLKITVRGGKIRKLIPSPMIPPDGVINRDLKLG